MIALLNGDRDLLDLVNESEWTGISIITVLEFRSYAKLSEEHQSIFEIFLAESDVISLQLSLPELISIIVQTRQKSSLKLPDSIIAASAIYTESILLTKDKQVLSAGVVPSRSW